MAIEKHIFTCKTTLTNKKRFMISTLSKVWLHFSSSGKISATRASRRTRAKCLFVKGSWNWKWKFELL